MTDITKLAQREKFEAWFKSSFHPDKTGPYIKDQLYFAWKAAGAELAEALEKAQGMEAYWKTQCRGITDHCEELQARIAELEREQEHLRPVGVMSEKAFHRLENSECRFIALWPRPGIFLPRKRPEDGVIVYARTAASAGIKVEAE
ncbi:ead/Ea22-like family protein [Escherichia coli]|uniref:ead/Ea22-like family protein n=2 Tax=Enterobacteriaceae TaxID=543 RepID=UPI001B10DC99|nr:ead/Ea22-like family protein [Escherichia coli]HAZ7209949.1 ead/Ea22-like family protein [Escherichia coli]